MPSLIDYMDQGSSNKGSLLGGLGSQTKDILQIINGQQSTSDAYMLDLSPEAQRILAEQQNGTTTQSGEAPNHIKNAQQHFINFFEENGIDFDNLSAEATELLGGLTTFLADSGTTARDTAIDTLELQASDGERDVYTLTGNERRIRIAIEKNSDGQNMLTLTDIHQNKADIAQMVVNKNGDGNAPVITLTRSQETFANGRKIDREEQDPITIKT